VEHFLGVEHSASLAEPFPQWFFNIYGDVCEEVSSRLLETRTVHQAQLPNQELSELPSKGARQTNHKSPEKKMAQDIRETKQSEHQLSCRAETATTGTLNIFIYPEIVPL
jgi:hypothetical protein